MRITAHSITAFDSERSIPEGWQIDPEKPDRLLPPWSYCQYRRVSYRPQTLVITPICCLISQRVTTETCLSCHRQLEEKPLSDPSGLPLLEKSAEDLQGLSEAIDGEFDELNGEFDRAAPLPPKKDSRIPRIESDGAIVYEKREGDWEPPRDINGYRRDPDNPWRFISLWPECERRAPIKKRAANHGCVRVVMKCKNRDSNLHGEVVTYEQCQQCRGGSKP